MAAANSIFKLKVETSEYDQKLANAAKGIRHLAEVAHQGGGELTGLEKSELDYIKALGEMETKSRTAAGSVRELESTYKELKVIYDQLNEVEKADEGGKALAASLEQIKQRAQDARAQLDNASKSLNDNGQSAQQSSGFLEALASKFTINIDALKLFDIGLKAAGVALDVAKDAFFASEATVDEWGRTLRSADGIYQSFLQSLNTGDFSGFLNNIGQVTQAAREAYNALDELGTRMTIINPERAKLQARQQELRADIRRNGADSEVGKAALAELKKMEPLLSKSYKTESQMNYAAFEKLVRERLAEGGINLNQKSFNDFMKTFSNDAAFQSLKKNARGSLTTEMTGNAYNPNAVMTRRTVDTRNTEQKLLDLFTDEWRKANSGYLTAAFNAQGAAASNMLGNSRYMKTTSGGGSGGGGGKTTTTTGIKDEFTDMEELVGLIPVAEQKVKDLQQQIRESWDQNVITTLRKQLKEAQNDLDVLQGKLPKDTTAKMKISIDSDTLHAIEELDGVTFDDKTLTVTANTSEALQKVQELVAKAGGEVIEIKVVPQWTDADVEKEFQRIHGEFAKQQPTQTPSMTRGQQIEQSIRIKLAGENMEADKQTLRTLLEAQIKNGIEGVDIPADWITDQIFGEGVNIPDEYWTNLQEQINEKLRDMGIDPINIDFRTGKTKDDKKKDKEDKEEKKYLSDGVSKLAGGLGGLQSGFAQLGIDLGDGFSSVVGGLQGISSILMAIQTIVAAIEIISSADAIIPFAHGGIVPHAANGYFVGGTHFSGDVTPIMANAGELVLNKSQQGNLASQLSGSGMQNMKLDAVITGEQIRLVLNNNGRRTGRGEYVQTKSGRM